jgi:DNA-binding CsgD family transcriptional regulator
LIDPPRLGALLCSSITESTVPFFATDRDGVVQWQNDAAVRLFGSVRGRSITWIVAVEDVPRAESALRRKLDGDAAATDYEIDLRATTRRAGARITSFPLTENGEIVGVFGWVNLRDRNPAGRPALTDRQRQVLQLLDEGLTTAQIAGRLGLASETVRNHVRALLRELGVNTRLQAVAAARREGLLP